MNETPYEDDDSIDSQPSDPYELDDVESIDRQGDHFEANLSEPVGSEAGTSADIQADAHPPPLPGTYSPTQFASSDIAATTIHCSGCGYNLTGITIGGTCPECGMGVGESIMMGANQTTSGLAVASMVIGIIAILPAFCPCVGVVLPLIGLPLGVVAINQCTPGRFASASRGMSIAGIITNSIALAIQGLLWLTAFL